MFLGGPPAWVEEPKPPAGELPLDGQGRSPLLLSFSREGLLPNGRDAFGSVRSFTAHKARSRHGTRRR